MSGCKGGWRWVETVAVAAIGVVLLAGLAAAQQGRSHSHHVDLPPYKEPPATPLRKALMLLRESRIAEARTELHRLQKESPEDPEILYQIARSHLLDFYSTRDFEKRRISLGLAMEVLAAVIKHAPNHIPALRAKAVIHARAELLYYDPDLAFELASRVAKLEPHASEYVLSLTEWMSGEVRFTHESGHRVPHDPLLGLDRSIDLLDYLLDHAVPYSNEESAAYFMMGKTLARRGSFSQSAMYFKQALTRTLNHDQRQEALRELGAAYFRMGDYWQAAAHFYEAIQFHRNSVDQYLLHATMEQIPGTKPPIPQDAMFPIAAPQYDKANPPLLDFEDIAPLLGIDRLDGNGTVAWGDMDGDGAPDVFLAGSGTFIAVFRNDGGKFTEVTKEVGLNGIPSGYSLNLVDYDNDGRLDLYISLNGWSGPMKNRLFRNVGGRFEDVCDKSGACDEGNGFVSLWGDLDNDGYLDLFVSNGVLKDGSVPQIYRNNGDGTFTNMTEAAGIREPASHGAIGIALGDYDKDGDLDLLINGLDPSPNRLYRNDGNWKFTEVSKQAGVVQPVHNGFVCFFFDYNNDGWPDILTTSLASWDAVVEGLKEGFRVPNPRAVHPDSSRLFRNNGNGTFSDVTFESKLYYPAGTMGAGVADLDNDGYIDVYLGTGDPQLVRLEPNRFFRNNGDGTFSDLTRITPFGRHGSKGHGVAFIDLDEDGDLEIYTQLGGHYPADMARNAFYRNRKGNGNHWLQMDLEGVRSNRYGIGAQVTVKAGGSIFYRELKGSEGFGSTDPYRVHFGLGRHAEVNSVEIRWPSGVVQELGRTKSNQILRVKEAAESK